MTMSESPLTELCSKLNYHLARWMMARATSWREEQPSRIEAGKARALEEEKAIERLIRQWVKDNPEEVGGDQG